MIGSVDWIGDRSIGIAQEHVALCGTDHFAEVIDVTRETAGIAREVDRNKRAADICKWLIEAPAAAYGIAADEVAGVVIPEDGGSH